jgi:hypothetical protein
MLYYVLYSHLDMRKDVQAIFKLMPHTKQVMMFSATLAPDIRAVCKRFMHNVSLIFQVQILFDHMVPRLPSWCFLSHFQISYGMTDTIENRI